MIRSRGRYIHSAVRGGPWFFDNRDYFCCAYHDYFKQGMRFDFCCLRLGGRV